MKKSSHNDKPELTVMVFTSVRVLALILFAGALVRPVLAASYYWAGTGTTASSPAGGNWDATTTDWSTTASGAPTVVWGAAGSTAVFGGTDGTYGVNMNSAINNPQVLLFSNSGYTLSNTTTPRTISFNGGGSGAAPNIQIVSGKTATIGTNITVSSGATTIWGNINGNAGGELDIQNGGTLSPGGGTVGMVGVGTLTSVKTGGKINISSATTTLILGSVISPAIDSCTLSIDGGAVSFLGSTTIKVGGSGTAGAVAGTLTVNNGSLSMLAGNTTVGMTLGVNANNLGTNNLNGGIERVNKIAPGSGSGYVNFNGGVLQAVNGAFASTFLTGLTRANVRNNGAIIDNNGFNITIGQALLHSAIAGDNATDGGLTVSNSGTAGPLTLTGANTYNGPTVVETGAYLATTTASTGAGPYTVNDGASLEAQVTSAGGQLAMSALTLGTSGPLTNVFTLGSNASTTTPAVAASGALTLNGTVTVNVTGSGLTGPNTYLLLSYASMTGSGSFAAGSLPTVAGFIGSLTNDTAAGELKLVYSLAPQPVSWAVGNQNWDTTTPNWNVLGSSGPLTNYVEGATAAFDDSASGSSPITVTLAANHSPTIVTNNSTKDYIFAGGYNLQGSILIKDGSSTLILDNGSGNSFTSVAVNNGTLQVGNGDANGSLGSSGVANNGTLAFNRADNPTFANVISGSGGVAQDGAGSVTISGANSYAGTTVVNAGKLTTTTASAGAGAFMVADGATLEVQVGAAGKSLASSGLTLGASGSLTTLFTLGANGSTTVPVIQDNGALALNGTVTVNVTGSGLAAGAYPLLSYASISGSGNFVAGSLPTVTACTGVLTNDTTAKQLKLIYTSVSTLTWDAGNTANGATIDAGNGTWDTTPGNVVWNDNGINRIWGDSIGALFAGADGSWSVNLATNVSPTALTFENDGYAVSALQAQTITLSASGSGAAPNLKIAAGKTAFIGTNVTLQTTGANNLIFGGPAGAGNPGGTLEIDNGGTVQLAGNSSLGLVGTGTTVSVRPGGVFGRTSTGTLLLGSVAGDNCVLSVDGGSVSLTGSGAVHIGGNGTVANAAGSLNLNSGSFSMDAANTTVPMTLGVLSENLGTNNLNGGTLSVNQIVKGNAGATSVFNFNGGTLRAVNGALGANFMTGLDTANVRNGGAVVDNNGFAVTIGQALVHSTVGGDSAIDGGLTCLGNGSLTLTNANTYTGNTTVSNGTLALSGTGSIANSANINLMGASAVLNVSAVTGGYTLAGGQTLSGIGVVTGAVTVASSAVLAPGNGGAGVLTFSNSLALDAASTNSFVVTTDGGASNQVVVAGRLTPNNSVVSITSGTPLHPGTNILFSYGSASGSFTATPVFDVAPVHTGSMIIDNGSGQIELAVPNQPPVAGPSFTMGATIGFPATVQIVGGMYSPTDADGDTLTIIGVSGAENGTVTTDGTNITYTATNGVADTFTYTVSDGFGGAASQTVYVTINTIGQNYNQLGAQLISGQAVLSFAGVAGYQYALEWTHSLTPPVTWTPLLTNTAANNGSLLFTNTPSGEPDFYRTRYLP